MLAHLVHVVQHGQHGAALGMPGVQQGQQVAGGAGVHAHKGFIQQDDGRVLQQQPGKQCPLELPARQRGDGAVAKAAQAHGFQRLGAAGAVAGADAAPGSQLVPQAHRHHVGHRDGKAAVHFSLLRQVGHAHGMALALGAGQALHLALHGLEHARQRLDQCGLARAVGADHGQQVTRRNAGVQVVDGGVALVAQRQVVQDDVGRPDGGGLGKLCHEWRVVCVGRARRCGGSGWQTGCSARQALALCFGPCNATELRFCTIISQQSCINFTSFGHDACQPRF